MLKVFLVATVLTVYGIETEKLPAKGFFDVYVATVLTVYGIETLNVKAIIFFHSVGCNSPYRLRY